MSAAIDRLRAARDGAHALAHVWPADLRDVLAELDAAEISSDHQRTRADAAEADRDHWRAQATAAAPCVDAVRAITTLLIPGGTGCAVDPERVVAAVDGLRAECDRIDAAASRAAGEYMEAAHGLASERDAARRAATLAETERDTLRALTDSMREDNVRLRAIIEGRATAPTEAELVAHIAAGGRWLVSSPGEPDVPLWSMPVASVEHGLRVAQDHHDLNAPWRWHALLDGRPCPWPTPALDAAGEGR